MSVFAVVTGGGTAGHVYPALAVAEGLVAAGHDPASVHYVGTQRGVESALLADTPFPRTLLDVIGLARSLSLRNVRFATKLLGATRTARWLLDDLRPRVVVTVGGYGAMPAVLAAATKRVPIVVVSYDRRPGRANAFAARFASACAVAFADTKLPRAELTGAPVRRRVLDVDREGDRAGARARLGVDAQRFLITVIGGSLGSASLNGAVAGYVRAHAGDSGLAVRHVVGERYVTGHEPLPAGAGIQYDVLGFEPDLPACYAASDLLVGRGGASSVAEIAAVGMPAILVPWRGAAEDHQTGNVRWLSDQGAAVLLAERELGRLGDEIEALRADDDRRRSLSAAAAAAGRIHHGGRLPALIERVALP